MTQINYANIENLIGDQQVTGSTLNVTFRCPQTNVEVAATATLKKGTTISEDATRKVKKGLWSSLRRSVGRAITDALGSGTAGRVVRDVASSAIGQQEGKNAFSKTETQAGMVAAFETVQNRFRWDGENNCWVGLSEPTTAFAKRLQEAPVTEKFDRGVLARTLVELSGADGDIGDEERAFLGQFLDGELGTIEELAQRGPLTNGELGETTEPVRSSILMLGWATAMCDEDVADEEVARLTELATGFGIDEATNGALREDAQRFLFEQALAGVYEGGQREEAAFGEATAAAKRMGLEDSAIESFDASYRKRCGIV